MLKDVLTEAELKALLDETEDAPSGATLSALEDEDKKLLHALVRNQLRLLRMIEELQSEVRGLKAQAAVPIVTPNAFREAAASLEPLPLPFMKQQAAGDAAAERIADDEQKAPAADVSRKERFKRKSLW
ncbi:hypothetical protein MO973_05275 [Paenibacillus sp. TRM 82003]|nr:hypothetical protein [Paenibacillus sp. TRM 82003]